MWNVVSYNYKHGCKVSAFTVARKPCFLDGDECHHRDGGSNCDWKRLILREPLKLLLASDSPRHALLPDPDLRRDSITIIDNWYHEQRLRVAAVIVIVGGLGTFPLYFHNKRIDTTYSHVFLTAETESAS